MELQDAQRQKILERGKKAIVMETATRFLGTQYCICGSRMVLDKETYNYYCLSCGSILTRETVKKLNEEREKFREDARQFM